MALTAGFRLGPYEILSLLGAGGMGEVYRARDPRLGRDVAIKVLPPSFSADADRLRRFEQEAKAAGVLNHPNITTVYDIGSHDGAPYVVQELLEGETLRAELAGGRFSARKAIDYAQQIAQGLAAAHDKGIVHRDLKPENLFVTKDGRVKILDFGLAKLIRSDTAGSSSTTITATQGTEPGVVMGTVAYMSPEQVRGLAVDHRSDIFSFGSTLYEMLSGEPAFRGGSRADVMSAIINEEPPDISLTNPGVSPAFDRILRHCLERSPEQRFQSARDLAFDLQGLQGVPGGPQRATGSPRAASAAGHPSYRRVTFRRGSVVSACFSPDSQTIIYCARWESAPREMYATRLDGPESHLIGPPNSLLHAISSSGEMALVLGAGRPLKGMARGILARMPLAGGAPRDILEDVLVADWLPDGKDLAVVRIVDGRERLDFPIGNRIYEPTGWISSLRVSPSGDCVAFIDHPSVSDLAGSVMVANREGRLERLSGLWSVAHGLAWRPGGQEVWFTASNEGVDRSLHAVTREGEERLVEQVPGGLFLHDISRTGSVLMSHTVSRSGILCRVGGEPGEKELSWLDFSLRPDLSGDGRVVLFTEKGGGVGGLFSVYFRKTDGSPAVRLGEGEGLALSPDGRWALSMPVSLTKLLLIPMGAGQTREIAHDGFTYHQHAAWFPDGKRILLAANQRGRQPRSYVHDLDRADASPVTPEGTIAYAISPDGRHLAAGDPVVKLYPVAGGDPKSIAGVLPGDVPIRWHEDGRSLFVRSGFLPAQVMRVDLATGLRESFLELMPSDPAGVVSLGTIALTPDASSYAYSYARSFSDLYVAEGMR